MPLSLRVSATEWMEWAGQPSWTVEETTKLAQKLLKLNGNVVRYTKEAIKAVRNMDDKQARDYLKSKQDSLSRNDKEIREQHGMKQFLDEKSYRPGLGPFRKVENV